MLALAMLLWFAAPGVVGSARASACHLPERPSLGIDPPGGLTRHVPAWGIRDASASAPPIFTRVPCPGESARTVAVAMVPGMFAGPGAFAHRPEAASGPWIPFDDIDRVDPRPSRLDRPPR